MNDDTIAWWENTDGQGTYALGLTLSTTIDGAFDVHAADMDRDGDLDLVAAASIDNRILVFTNIDGAGGSWGVLPVDLASLNARHVLVADIDGDGDPDILSASQDDDTIAWHQNVNGDGATWTKLTISTTAGGASAAFPADVDGDGDLDVFAAALDDDTVGWYENTDGSGSFGTLQPISSTINGPADVYGADVDRDGDIDLVAAAFFDDAFWYENTDGVGGSWTAHSISAASMAGTQSAEAVDMDRDGDLDAVVTSTIDDTIAWFENLDGAGNFGPILTVSAAADGAFWATGADLDDDGDVEVIGASFVDDTVAWFENQTIHSTGAWSRAETFALRPYSQISFDPLDPSSVFAADLDGDGDLDALAQSLDGTTWYPNTDGRGDFGATQTIDATPVVGGSAFAADLDGDGDADVLVSQPAIAWHENTDGLGSFGAQQLIDASAGSVLLAVDLDGDGDNDVLTGSPSVGWYENLDGAGSFGPLRLIDAASASGVFAGDLDGDGDLDVLSQEQNGALAWYANTDGLATFGSPQIIDAAPASGESVFAADLDGDRDLDVVYRGRWVENIDGSGTFGAPQVFGSCQSCFLSDVDGDSDIDVITGSAWYENTDGLGTFSLAQTFRDFSFGAVFVADVDGDGDVLAAYDIADTSSGADEIAWFENADGRGGFVRDTISAHAQIDPSTLAAADVDRDGDLDVFSSGSATYWHENVDGRGGTGSTDSWRSAPSISSRPTSIGTGTPISSPRRRALAWGGTRTPARSRTSNPTRCRRSTRR